MGDEVRRDHGHDAGQDRAFDPEAQLDQDVGPDQADQTFNHQVDGQGAKGLNSLNVAAAYAQRNIKDGAQSEERDQRPARKLQVIGDGTVEQEQEKSDADAGDPGTHMQGTENGSLFRVSAVAG